MLEPALMFRVALIVLRGGTSRRISVVILDCVFLLQEGATRLKIAVNLK